MLYFVPSRKSVSAHQLSELGLSHAIDSPITRECLSGPGNHAGVLVAESSIVSAALLSYNPGGQEWRRMPGGGSDAPSVGRHLGDQITPELLARPRQLPGPSIELLDGRRWTVPLVRTWSVDDTDPRILYSDTLPRVLDVDDSGDFIQGGFVPQFARLAERSIAAAESVYDQLTGRESSGANLDPQEILGLAVELLGTNYRVGRAEVALMRLLDRDLATEIVRQAIDADQLVESIKNLASRRLSGGTNSHSGDVPPTTDSHTPTGQPSAS